MVPASCVALFLPKGADGEPVASPFMLNSGNISISSATRIGVFEDGLLIDEVTKHHQELASVYYIVLYTDIRGGLGRASNLSFTARKITFISFPFQPTASRL